MRYEVRNSVTLWRICTELLGLLLQYGVVGISTLTYTSLKTFHYMLILFQKILLMIIRRTQLQRNINILHCHRKESNTYLLTEIISSIIFIIENTLYDFLKRQGCLLKLLSFIRDFYSKGILLDEGIYKKTNVSICKLDVWSVFFETNNVWAGLFLMYYLLDSF